MKIPRHEDVQVDESKVSGYLLSEAHPIGRFKARFFRALGFQAATPQGFIGELRRIAAEGEVAQSVETSFGHKYLVPGELRGPRGSAWVITVWFVERGGDRARLITVHPR